MTLTLIKLNFSNMPIALAFTNNGSFIKIYVSLKLQLYLKKTLYSF